VSNEAERDASVDAAVTVEATPSNRRRNILIAAIVANVVIIALALVILGPGEQPFNFPADAITANIEALAPHVVLDLDPSNPPPPGQIIVFHPSISSSLFTMWIVMAVAIVLVIASTRRRREIPGPFQNFIEFMFEALGSFGESLGGKKARAFMPLFATLFVFIILSNWSGLVPPVGKVPALRAPTSDVNITIGLALVSFATFHFSGVRYLGFRGYFGKFFNFGAFRHGIGAGAIALFVGLVEFFLEFVKPITLAMRLFGNIFGGELALGVITALTLAVIPVALYGLEVFVGFVQALIFSVLTLMFTLLAIESHEEEHHDTPGFDLPEGAIGPTVMSQEPPAHAPAASVGH
jgi:F-type H+-transporting ATPase subunit a